MTLLQPIFLWSLLALLPLAALYFLKVRPRRKTTTAFFLWEQVFVERRSSSLFRRLRDAWSLLLMLIIAAAICLALAQPQWKDRRQDLLIVIDNSASMAAKEGGQTRLTAAKRIAADIIEGLDGNQRAAVASAADKLVYRSHLTDDPRELLDAAQSIEVSPQSLRLDSIPDSSDANTHFLRDHRVVLISDACFHDQKLPGQVDLLKVGSPLGNVGIIASDLVYLPLRAGRVLLYCQIASSFSDTREVDLTIAHIDDDGNERPAKVIPLKVAPGVNRAQTFTIEGAQPGKWVARLGVDDALAEDNVAYLVASQPERIRVGVQSENRFFLERSVQAFSQAAGGLQLVREKPQVVLANGAASKDQRLLLFHPAGQSPWWRDVGEPINVVSPRVLVEKHPALRYVDVASILFVGARRLSAPPGAQVLVADEHNVPLVYVARHGEQSAVVVNMDPMAADFYFSAWFPAIVYSTTNYLAGRDQPLVATYRPGEIAAIPGATDDTHSRLIDPSGKATDLRGKQFTVGDHLGYWQVSNSAGRWTVASSVLAESETLLGDPISSRTPQPLSRGHSPAYWLILVAAAVLTVESVLYHRRKAG